MSMMDESSTINMRDVDDHEKGVIRKIEPQQYMPDFYILCQQRPNYLLFYTYKIKFDF